MLHVLVPTHVLPMVVSIDLDLPCASAHKFSFVYRAARFKYNTLEGPILLKIKGSLEQTNFACLTMVPEWASNNDRMRATFGPNFAPYQEK